MSDILITVLGVYGAIILVMSIVQFKEDSFILPDVFDIYDGTSMNWFGCILVSISIIMFNPIVSIGWLIYKLIYFICHVGRKDDE